MMHCAMQTSFHALPSTSLLTWPVMRSRLRDLRSWFSLQGVFVSCFPGGRHHAPRFAIPCISAAFLALISSMRWVTESEDEEIEQINSMLLALILDDS